MTSSLCARCLLRSGLSVGRLNDVISVCGPRCQKDEGETKGHVDEFWFLTDPEDFNFLCHPEEADKQLMTSAWSMEVFLGLPGLKPDFFKSSWKLLGPHTALVDTKNGRCSVDFQVGLRG